jgi:hypothetical protein
VEKRKKSAQHNKNEKRFKKEKRNDFHSYDFDVGSFEQQSSPPPPFFF